MQMQCFVSKTCIIFGHCSLQNSLIKDNSPKNKSLLDRICRNKLELKIVNLLNILYCVH
jgi:hypothetical protein